MVRAATCVARISASDGAELLYLETTAIRFPFLSPSLAFALDESALVVSKILLASCTLSVDGVVELRLVLRLAWTQNLCSLGDLDFVPLSYVWRVTFAVAPERCPVDLTAGRCEQSLPHSPACLVNVAY